MPLSTLINRPCTILRRQTAATTTPYGRRRKTDLTVEAVCELQQQASTEPGDSDLADSGFLLVFLPGTDIRNGDAVVVDGHTYELTGEPWAARNPRTQTESHVEVSARRVAGTEETGS